MGFERMKATDDNRLLTQLFELKDWLTNTNKGTGFSGKATWLDVAEHLRVSLSSINSYLNGNRSPSDAARERIEEAYRNLKGR